MGISFNADEIFEIAEQIERNGTKFYVKAASGMKDARVEKIFEDLAKMEERHLATFQAMRKELLPGDKTPTVFDPDGQGALYLQALADARIFDVSVDPSKKLTGSQTPAEILRMAIGLEKDSVAFYVGMRDMVPGGLGKDKVEKIIGEEMGHVTILGRELLRAYPNSHRGGDARRYKQRKE